MTIKIHQADFRGWNAYYLENEFIRLVAVPDIGGRIMAYDLGEYAYFFVDRDLAGQLFSPEDNLGDGSLAAWKNYGGDKTWPAPQGWDADEQWHGPPDPVLDTGRYAVELFTADDDSATIRMSSPPDTRTGVQIIRQFSIKRGSSRVQVDLAFRNISDKPIRWSIWDVAQLRAEKPTTSPDRRVEMEASVVITVPVNPNSKFDKGYYVMFGAEDNPQWQVNSETGLLEATYDWHIGKIGLDSTAGWIAFSNPAAGFAFVETFTPDPAGEYPDDGATVEIWAVGAGQVANLNYAETDIYLMETEILSPFETIHPGETASSQLEWGACHASDKVLKVTAAGLITKPFSIKHQNNGVLITGVFGVFDRGDLSLVWYAPTGDVVGEQPLQPVDPITEIRLDAVVALPDSAAFGALIVKSDGETRLLAQANIV